ncbi:hypothetical protein GCM10011348_29670 [Marinobacterium nitratireducens]|uniref:Protein TonB n=1 Tax=Marinobacterium nitratireducens TaxID=518897 RepID=A0A917ZK69_9GAMM|nr:energy transducer TonB [Marinobacterium nitratireducens]GGO84133.1 hypothetical protein GCM10011348_29670 [Marinobacterium nitratireducens]
MIRTRHWLTALLLAVALHLFGFVVVLLQDAHDGARTPGEQGIEIDLGMLGDLGTETEPQEAAVSDPLPEPEPQPQPQPQPETVPEPEPEPVVKPDPVTPKQQAEVGTAPTSKPNPKPKPRPVHTPDKITDSEATEQIDSRKASTGGANAATNGGNPAAQQSYYAVLAAHLAKYKRYPVASRRRGEEGIVKLFFVLDHNGKVESFRISESSGYRRLDEAVIRMLQSAVPLPAFPAEMEQHRLSVNIPIAFAIKGQR